MVAVYLLDTYQFFQLFSGASSYVQSIIPLTPIKTILMFQDFPLDRQLYDLLLSQKSVPSFDALDPITQEVLSKILSEGRQQGTMDIPFLSLSIVNGQFFRIFTPALLHANFIHILFNLLWFAPLGSMIEKRAGPLKLLVMILLTGSIANVAQFFVTGPLFLGVSGVVCALAGFIFIRTKRAPWEGYPLSKSGISLLFIYILFLTLLELFGQVFVFLSGTTVVSPIANTAHLTGALFGGILGFNRWFRCST
ncbi:MAG: rhomboid family intramembrane serine protease [Chlamydiae bacterium]|nr:rhomboid family intramembrane serine protease [Chlamydiota bacterium]